jgi:non-canonical purine NTP pyrophosphatase (RdgB/HAM1 family)
MNHVIFATGNQRKIKEATSTLEPLGIQIEHRAVDIDEIQHHDPAEITKAKARAAYEVIHAPVVVQDTNWSIAALGGFPGGYMKDVAEWWAPEDWIQIMARHSDRTLFCHEHVVYFVGDQIQLPGHLRRSATRQVG